MDITISRDTAWADARCESRDRLYNLLDTVLSYPIPGAEFSEKFRTHVWDGRGRLHSRPRGGDVVRFPAGMVDRVATYLRDNGHRVEGALRPAPVDPVAGAWRWVGPTPYRHQAAAVARTVAALSEAVRDPLAPPGGILRMPIRSGKTLTAARIAYESGLKTLFVVPSDYLLYQGLDAFRSFIDGAEVGVFAGGQKDTEPDIIIATVQSLTAAKDKRSYHKLSKQPRLLIVDEVHHKAGATGTAWRDSILGMRPHFTLGLSATFKLEDDPEEATNALWLRAVCGPIIHDIGMTDLIRKGFLAKPVVRWLPHGAPKLKRKSRSPSVLYSDGIVECAERNAVILDTAADLARNGHRVLIDVARVGHTRLLNAGLKERLGPAMVGMVTGSTKTAIRQALVRKFRAGTVRVLVGTVLGEGVDIPELDVVINAVGGRGYIPVIQRMRCLTPAPGKAKGIVVELIDDHHRLLREATVDRYEVYLTETGIRHEFEGELR